MSIITRGADLVYTFRFLRLLTTAWTDTTAYKLGIIDEDGNRDKKKVPYIDSEQLKSAYTPFHKIVFNIKKLLNKVPGGKSKIGSYAAALYLIKENYNVSDKNLDKILKASNIDVREIMQEKINWFIMKDGSITPGTYIIANNKVLASSPLHEELCYEGDKIRIDSSNNTPIGQAFGINIYEALHINTNHKVYISAGELVR
jgi:hypothetical protein|tara:strand:- start:1496 stop:2098 length:603 start_codon:yes stop_codon:yes gene_type:complete